MKPSEVMPENIGGGGTSIDWLEKKKRTISTKQMPRPNVTRSWSSCGRV